MENLTETKSSFIASALACLLVVGIYAACVYSVAEEQIKAAYAYLAPSKAHASTAPDQTETLLKQTRARAYQEGFEAGQTDGISQARETLREAMLGSVGLYVTKAGDTWEIARVRSDLTNPLDVCEALAARVNAFRNGSTYTCVVAK